MPAPPVSVALNAPAPSGSGPVHAQPTVKSATPCEPARCHPLQVNRDNSHRCSIHAYSLRRADPVFGELWQIGLGSTHRPNRVAISGRVYVVEQAIDLIYETVADPTLWDEVARVIGDEVGATASWLVEPDLMKPNSLVIMAFRTPRSICIWSIIARSTHLCGNGKIAPVNWKAASSICLISWMSGNGSAVKYIMIMRLAWQCRRSHRLSLAGCAAAAFPDIFPPSTWYTVFASRDLFL